MHAPLSSLRRDFYPPLDPYQTDMLQVSPLHTVYYEQSGNPRGAPALAFFRGKRVASMTIRMWCH